jgi:hypothetical protein
MIPVFPEFKKLDFTDREYIEKINKRYKPYSDFNFTSLWAWDIENEVLISELNGNIVVRFLDYLTLKPFYSFLGTNETTDTVEKLLALCKKENLDTKLKLIPEDSALMVDSSKFKIEEDRDHFDYILDNEKLKDYNYPGLGGHASFKKRLIDMHSADLTAKILDVRDPSSQEAVISLNELWIKNKVTENKDVFPDAEDKAMKKFFHMEKQEDKFLLTGVFFKDKMVAFTIDELLANDYSIRHFMKGDSGFKGLYSYLISESSNFLVSLGKRHTNIEQDLGLPNLRQSKKSYQPAHFLKKYSIALLDQVYDII